MRNEVVLAKQVYVSYHIRDIARMEPILDKIKARFSMYDGCAPDVDQGAATEFDDVQKANAVIVVWSSNSVQSDWVNEIAALGSKHNKLFGIQLGNVTIPSGYTYVNQKFDAGDPLSELPQNLDELLDAVDDFLHGKSHIRKLTSDAFVSVDIFANFDTLDLAVNPILDEIKVHEWSIWEGLPSLKPGQFLDTATAQAFSSAKCVITFWSKYSTQNNHVLERATHQSQDVLQISIALDSTFIPEEVRGKIHFDISSNDPGEREAAIARLIKAIEDKFEFTNYPVRPKNFSYQDKFLALLNNKAKHDRKLAQPPWTPRKKGFILLVNGTVDLQEFEQLCLAQLYNTCYTVRFDLDFLGDIRSTLTSFVENAVALEGIGTYENSRLIFTPDRDIWTKRFGNFSDWLTTGANRILDKGERVVLFLEVSGISEASKLSGRDFEKAVYAVFNFLLLERSERIGIVFSGIPKHIVEGELPEGFYGLSIPPDRIPEKHVQPCTNDLPTGPDTLGIQDEVTGLADSIALRETKPPLVVGILGGWGTGKSFVLELLKRRLTEIRCQKIDDPEKDLYVGHIYLIEFNAWTYSKSNLWSSLMHDIFVRLNNQLTVEKALIDSSEDSALCKNHVWKNIYEMDAQGIGPFLESELGKEALKKWVTDSGDGKTLWEHLRKLQEPKLQALETVKEQIACTDRQIREKKKRLDDELELELEKLTRKTTIENAFKKVGSAIGQSLQESLIKRFEKEGVDFAPTQAKIIKEFHGWKDLLKNWNTAPTALVTLLVLSIVLSVIQWKTGAISEFFSSNVLDGLLKEVAPMALFVLNAIAVYLKWMSKIRNVLRQANLALDSESESVRAERRTEASQRISKALGLEKLEEESKRLHEEEHRIEARIGPVAEFQSVHDFVTSRINEQDYETGLGILHKAQKDLKYLNSAISTEDTPAADPHSAEKRELFPRGDARIFLIIDDIDRCPPAQVVEVLEAAQLLVKTKLFVVILAMDLRYVTRALEKRYEGILVHDGEPSGMDYIEKIIQVPYRVRSMQSSSIGRFLQPLMGDFNQSLEQNAPASPTSSGQPAEGANDTPAIDGGDESEPVDSLSQDDANAQEQFEKFAPPALPPEAMTFAADEYQFMLKLCQKINLSPRAAKRVVNVFKIMKIIWYRRESEPDTRKKQSMLLLLVLSAGFPEVMKHVLSELQAQLESENSGDKLTLQHLIESTKRKVVTGDTCHRSWGTLSDVIREQNQAIGRDFNLQQYEIEDIHLISAFSFVGEVGVIHNVDEISNRAQS